MEKNTFFTKNTEHMLFLEYWVRGVGPSVLAPFLALGSKVALGVSRSAPNDQKALKMEPKGHPKATKSS